LIRELKSIRKACYIDVSKRLIICFYFPIVIYIKKLESLHRIYQLHAISGTKIGDRGI